MKTTELYFEYVIIGLETLCWIVILFFLVIGNSMLGFLKYCVSNIFSSIVLIGVCYILGLVMDRVADRILENRKQRIKKSHMINSKTSLLVWRKYNQSTFAEFTLSRIRILRATIFNSILIAILGAGLVQRYYTNLPLSALVICVFGAISIASNIGHKSLLENYYNKTSILDSVLVSDSQRNGQ